MLYKAVKDEVIVDLVDRCRTNQKKLMQMLTTTGLVPLGFFIWHILSCTCLLLCEVCPHIYGTIFCYHLGFLVGTRSFLEKAWN